MEHCLPSGAANSDHAEVFQKLFHTDSFHVEATQDVAAVEMCGPYIAMICMIRYGIPQDMNDLELRARFSHIAFMQTMCHMQRCGTLKNIVHDANNRRLKTAGVPYMMVLIDP